jgi:hypothetical protein
VWELISGGDSGFYNYFNSVDIIDRYAASMIASRVHEQRGGFKGQLWITDGEIKSRHYGHGTERRISRASQVRKWEREQEATEDKIAADTINSARKCSRPLGYGTRPLTAGEKWMLGL